MRILILFVLLACQAFGTWGNGYTYRRTLTINKTGVPNTDQVNFPVLFRTPVGTVNTSGTNVSWANGDHFPTWLAGNPILINSVEYTVATVTNDSALVLTATAGSQSGVVYNGTPYLRHTSHGGKVSDINGYDIIFASDAVGSTKLDHETESYDHETGVGVWHHREPTVATGTDTVFYIFYTNTSVTTSQEAITGVWDANYKAVLHLPNGTDLTALDSTSNNNDGTISTPTAVAGQIGGAAHFNGTADYISIPATGGANSTLTLSVWVNWVSNSSYAGVLFMRSASPTGIFITWGGTYELYWNGTYASSVNPTAVWAYKVMTVSGTSGKLYDCKAGACSTESFTVSGSTTYDTAWMLAQDNCCGGRFLHGTLDEARISYTARSADWIATEYNNQYSPGTFYALGAETEFSGAARRRIVQ